MIAGYHEIKFLLPTPLLPKLGSQLSALGFVTLYPSRTVHSLYLDTDTLALATAHKLERLTRYKARLRWYNENDNHKHLELKAKHNRTTSKSSRRWTNLDSQLTPGCVELCQQHVRTYGIRLRSPTQPMLPNVSTHYRREYWQRSPQERITVDHSLEYRLPRQQLAASQHNVIVEYKCVEIQADTLHALSAFSPPERHSKYLQALAAFARIQYG